MVGAGQPSCLYDDLLPQAELTAPPPRYPAHLSTFAYLPRVTRASLSHRYHKPVEACGCTCYPRTPRTPFLCRLLVAMIAVMVFIQAISCGLFFCVTLPFGRRHYVEYRDLAEEVGLPSEPFVQPKGRPEMSAPKLIPRVIHQTYRSKHVPQASKQLMPSWHDKNGDLWQVRFYDDAACMNFVRREFPEYLEAYLNLPKDVERADFFR